MKQYFCNLNKAIAKGIKLRIGAHFFIVIIGITIYCVYKRYEKSVVCIDNIRC